jgi:hypothetical protein
MLTISRSTWFASALAALVALAAGFGVAASTGTSPASDATGAPGILLEHGGVHCPPGNPTCEGEEHEEDETNPDIPDNTGGGGVCTFDNGGNDDGTITVADEAGETVEMVLAAQTGEVVIPCNHPVYGFYSDGCFWGDPHPLVQFPDDIPEGATEDSGAWYYGSCIASVIGELPNQDYYFFAVIRWQWFDNADVPVVTPEQVAQDWLASVDLYGVEFQLAPPETGAGLVTLPVWLGVAETENTWGPIHDQHCIGVCVSITAEVSTVEWSMGDGGSETCTRDQHVAWQSGMNYLAPGNNCHHYYQRSSRNQPDGKYQITATSTWTVHWVSQVSDVEDDITTTREATAALQIDEIQVLTR